jgi:outer membrane lipoprotein-sorting protein
LEKKEQKRDYGHMLNILLLLILLPFNVYAASKSIVLNPSQAKYYGDDQVPISVYKKYEKEIAEVENYFNSFKTLTAKFKQASKNGEISYGNLFISKPGAIRCQYITPSPILLIINKNKITYYDQALDELSYTNSDVNALNILALEQIKFNQLKLLVVDKDEHFISFMVKEYSLQLNQDLIVTLTLSYPNIVLKSVTVTTRESEMDVIFDQLVYNPKLSKQLFYFNRGVKKNSR